MRNYHTRVRRVGNVGGSGAMAAILAVALAVVSPTVLCAQDQEREQDQEKLLDELEDIHQIADPVSRLEAFDELATSLFGAPERTRDDGSAGGEDAEADHGAWVSWVDSDPITDERKFFAVLEAASGHNEFGTRPSLIIRRTGNTDEVYVTWSDYFAEDWARVTHRTDNAEPKSLSWPVSTDNDATFYPGDATAFVKAIMDAERLVLRTTPYNSAPITAIFRTAGLREIAGEHPELLADWLE